MKKIALLSLGLLFTFCSSPSKKSMSVSGKIDGLRKGTLYLQKMEDTLLVTVDSVEIKGDDSFSLGHDLKSPEFYFLSMAKDDGDRLTEKILFFGEKGDIKINTLLRTFESSAKVEGSENQVLWNEYQSIMRKFNNQNLDNLEKFMGVDSDLSGEERSKKLEEANQKTLKRKYLYALNFAMTNADKELAAYIGAYEVSDAVPSFLDSLYNTLTPSVKASKYGLAFKQQIDSLVR
jgi:hypothetical protein